MKQMIQGVIKIILFQVFISQKLLGVIIPPVAPLTTSSVNTVTVQGKNSVIENTNPNINPKIVTTPPIVQPETTPPPLVAKTVTQSPKTTVTPVKAVAVKPVVAKAVATVPQPVKPVVAVPTPVPVVTTPVKVTTPTVTTPTVTKTVTKTVDRSTQPKQAQMHIRRVLIQNMSKYPATLNGWTISCSDATNQKHEVHHTLANAHVLKPKSKKTGAVIAKIKEIPVSLPIGSSLHGISALKINGTKVDVNYKNVAWMPGQLTDVLYVTSSNGTTWKLDKKAMDKNYEKLSGTGDDTDEQNEDDENKNDDETANRISSTKKAVVAATLHQGKNNNQKSKKESRATKVATKG